MISKAKTVAVEVNVVESWAYFLFSKNMCQYWIAQPLILQA